MEITKVETLEEIGRSAALTQIARLFIIDHLDFFVICDFEIGISALRVLPLHPTSHCLRLAR